MKSTTLLFFLLVINQYNQKGGKSNGGSINEN